MRRPPDGSQIGGKAEDDLTSEGEASRKNENLVSLAWGGWQKTSTWFRHRCHGTAAHIIGLPMGMVVALTQSAGGSRMPLPRAFDLLKATNGAPLSNDETLPNGVPGQPRAGVELRIARERLGWALPDVAAMLRIRPSYLEAMEAGRFGHLPGKVYALGFLRSYATALGLDPEEMARRFQAETGEGTKQPELAFPVPVAERGLPAGGFILLGLILAAVAYTGWYHLSGEGKLPAETVTPVPARLATLAEQALPGPDGRIPVPAMPALAAPRPDENGMFEPRHAAAENPLLAAEDTTPAPIVEAAKPSQILSVAPNTAVAMPVERVQPQARETALPMSQPDQVTADGVRVTLRFTGETWVQIKERGGPVLISKIMKTGDTFPVPSRPNLVLTTGNAGRVEVLVDGTLAPAIGGAGSVRKDVPLDADQLKAGLPAPVPVAARH